MVTTKPDAEQRVRLVGMAAVGIVAVAVVVAANYRWLSHLMQQNCQGYWEPNSPSQQWNQYCWINNGDVAVNTATLSVVSLVALLCLGCMIYEIVRKFRPAKGSKQRPKLRIRVVLYALGAGLATWLWFSMLTATQFL